MAATKKNKTKKISPSTAKKSVAPKAVRSETAHDPFRVKSKSSVSLKEKLATVTPSGKKEASFFELVYDVAREIPKGRVTSYGAIASCLGSRISARVVGWAMNLAGSAKPKVPAHRVVNSSGLLSGKHHFGGNNMQQLLEKEGVEVKNDKIVDFKNRFWDPAEELLS